MNQTFSTTITDWQGVDDEPTAESNNLIKSGGVCKYTSALYIDRITPVEVKNGYYMNRSGMLVNSGHLGDSVKVYSYTDVIGLLVSGKVFEKIGYIYYFTDAQLSQVVSGVNHNTDTVDKINYFVPSGVNANYIAITSHDGYELDIFDYSEDSVRKLPTEKDVDYFMKYDYALNKGTRIVKYIGSDGSIKNNGSTYGYIYPISNFENIRIVGNYDGRNLSAYAVFNSNLNLNDLDNTFISANIVKIGGSVTAAGVHSIDEILPVLSSYAYVYVFEGVKAKIKDSNFVMNSILEDIDTLSQDVSILKTSYTEKKMMFIGDSFSARADNLPRTMFWRFLIDLKHLNVVVPNYSQLTPPNLCPAKGGIPLFPKEDETTSILESSIWYRCTQGKCTGWGADVIFLLGGANNDITLSNIGTIDDVAYVDNASNITEDNNITDVRPSSFTFASILKGCVLMLKAYNPNSEVILWSYPWNVFEGEVAEAMVDMIMKVANKYQLKFVPVYYDIPQNTEYIYDTIHPTANSNLLIARSICNTLLI